MYIYVNKIMVDSVINVYVKYIIFLYDNVYIDIYIIIVVQDG